MYPGLGQIPSTDLCQLELLKLVTLPFMLTERALSGNLKGTYGLKVEFENVRFREAQTAAMG